MAYFDDLNQEDINKLSDASGAGRPKSILDDAAMNEALGAIYYAINNLNSRVAALEGGT